MVKELTAAQARPRRSASSTGPPVASSEIETAASDKATADWHSLSAAQLTGTKREGEQLKIPGSGA